MRPRAFGFLLAVFILITAGLIAAYALAGKKTVVTPTLLPSPSASPSPFLRTVDDLYAVERQMSDLPLDWHDEITQNDADLTAASK